MITHIEMKDYNIGSNVLHSSPLLQIEYYDIMHASLMSYMYYGYQTFHKVNGPRESYSVIGLVIQSCEQVSQKFSSISYPLRVAR